MEVSWTQRPQEASTGWLVGDGEGGTGALVCIYIQQNQKYKLVRQESYHASHNYSHHHQMDSYRWRSLNIRRLISWRIRGRNGGVGLYNIAAESKQKNGYSVRQKVIMLVVITVISHHNHIGPVLPAEEFEHS